MKNTFLSFVGIALTLVLTSCVGVEKDYQNYQSTPDPIEETSVVQDIPNSCTSWFDGCNTCFTEDGKIGGCTRKFCPQELMQEPTCLQYKEDELLIDEEPLEEFSEEEVLEVKETKPEIEDAPEMTDVEIPVNCKTWYDGCNNCVVEDGKVTACTERACFRQDTPKCLEFFEE